jgi:hypothetical protein
MRYNEWTTLVIRYGAFSQIILGFLTLQMEQATMCNSAHMIP